MVTASTSLNALGQLTDLVFRRDLDVRGLHIADVTTGTQRLDERRQLVL